MARRKPWFSVNNNTPIHHFTDQLFKRKDYFSDLFEKNCHIVDHRYQILSGLIVCVINH